MFEGEHAGPDVFAFGSWQEHLNRAHGRYQVRIHSALRRLKAEAANRGFLSAPIGEMQKAAFSELRELIRDAVAWCQHEQDRGTCNASPFTKSREAEVIDSVHGLLDRLPNLLADTDDVRREVTRDCESYKAILETDLIRPRFYDGRADFRSEKVATRPAKGQLRKTAKASHHPPPEKVRFQNWAVAMEKPEKWWLFRKVKSKKNGHEWRQISKLEISKGQEDGLAQLLLDGHGLLDRQKARDVMDGKSPKTPLSKLRGKIRNAIARAQKRTEILGDPICWDGNQDCWQSEIHFRTAHKDDDSGRLVIDPSFDTLAQPEQYVIEPEAMSNQGRVTNRNRR